MSKQTEAAMTVPADDGFEKRQEVVSALWTFLREQQTRHHNARSRPLKDPNAPFVSANLDSVGKSADAIMALFGYDPTKIPVEGDGDEE